MNHERSHLDLFSGIGGFSLACRWCGVETIGFCEIDAYAQKVLIKNFGAVPVPDAIRCNGGKNNQGPASSKRDGTSPLEDSKGERCIEAGTKQSAAPNCPRLHGDIFNLNGADYRGVWLLTGGFPCQPFSCAGKRRGKQDDRALWPEMLRVITEARPAWIIAENVAGIASMVEFDSRPPMDVQGCAQGAVGEVFTRNGPGYLDEVLESIESAGYAVQPIIIPACALDARHRRDRVWIVAHAEGAAWQGRFQQDGWQAGQSGAGCGIKPADNGLPVSNTETVRQQGHRPSGKQVSATHATAEIPLWNGGQRAVWCPEPNVGRVAHGIPKRVDRLRGLGNSIVPQVAATIIASMIQSEP